MKWLFIGAMALVTYLIRALPLTIFQGKIKNKWLRSFLYYVPYVTLAVMTFPAILTATDHVAAGAAALIAGLIAAWISEDLFAVAISCCVVVFVMGLIL